MCIYVGKFSYNIRILSQKFRLASANICSLKTRIPSSLDFLMIFVAWRSPPSVDFARVLSTKSAKKHGFRARSDYSLLPKRKEASKTRRTFACGRRRADRSSRLHAKEQRRIAPLICA